MNALRHARNFAGLQIIILASAWIAGCDTQGGILPLPPGAPNPQPTTNPPPPSTPPTGTPSPFAKGTYIFSLKSDPIEGFTYTNSGAWMEHWTFRPPMTQGRSFSAGATLNDRIYSIGGNPDAATQVATVEMLDLPGTGVWSQVAPLSAPRTGVAAAAANGKIYAIGGFRTGVPLVGTNEEYDPATNTWTPRAPNPTPRSYATAVAVNDKVYVMGGSVIINNTFNDSTSVDEYDPVTNTWTAKAPMPVAMSTHAAAELNGKIHVVIGSTHLQYDPVANTWTPRKPMTTSRDRLGAFGWNGKLYAVGGRLNGGAMSNIVEEYSPEFDGWTPRMPVSINNARHSFGYAGIGPSFYRLGGTDANGNANSNMSIEYFAYTNVFPFRKN